jgi:glycosyltransferase involved in cell wall biosynthesis
MRVLHVIPAVAPRYGGPSTAIVPMCEALSAVGVEPTIVTTDADGPARLPVPIGELTSWGGVPAVFFRKSVSESFKYSRALGAWLDANVGRFDAVHIHALLSHACFAAAAACLKHGVPYIVRPLGTLAPWSLRQKPFKKRLLLTVAGMRVLRGAAAIHYTSSEEKRSVEATLDLADGVVIPLGIDPRLLDAPMIPEAERTGTAYVLALSRIHPKKNLEAVIEAFTDAMAIGSGPRWTLVIAGSGDAGYVGSLRGRVEQRGAGDRVRFTGWVDGDRKRELVRHASLFALCSKHENFGVAVLEALAAGVPAVVSREVDLAEDIERARAGWVVDAGEMLRDALVDAFDSARERESRGLAARALARRFAWPIVGDELRELYRRIAVATYLATSI